MNINLKNNKALMVIFGILFMVAIPFLLFYYIYYTNILFFNFLSWPWAFATILEKLNLLKENLFIRIVATTLFTCFGYFIFKLKKIKEGVILGIIEVSGGIATIYYSLGSHFENDVLYALALVGGIFLVGSGIEHTQKTKDEDKKD
jgi:hypothetical protein